MQAGDLACEPRKGGRGASLETEPEDVECFLSKKVTRDDGNVTSARPWASAEAPLSPLTEIRLYERRTKNVNRIDCRFYCSCVRRSLFLVFLISFLSS